MIDNNCHIFYLVQAFSIIENGGLKPVDSAKPLTGMTVASNSIIIYDV